MCEQSRRDKNIMNVRGRSDAGVAARVVCDESASYLSLFPSLSPLHIYHCLVLSLSLSLSLSRAHTRARKRTHEHTYIRIYTRAGRHARTHSLTYTCVYTVCSSWSPESASGVNCRDQMSARKKRTRERKKILITFLFTICHM
jgi:hypothetical protein